MTKYTVSACYSSKLHMVFVQAADAASALKKGLVEFWKLYWTNSNGDICDDMYQWQEYENTVLPDDVDNIKKTMSEKFLVECDVKDIKNKQSH